MTKEGEAEKQEDKVAVGLWFYITLFFALTMVLYAASLYGRPSPWYFSELELVTIMVISGIAVVLLWSSGLLKFSPSKEEVWKKKDEKKKSDSGMMIYVVLFCSLSLIFLAISVALFTISMTTILSSTFFSLLVVLLVMCCRSIPEVPLEYKEQEDERRRRISELERKEAKPIARAIVRKGYPPAGTGVPKRPIPGVTQTISDVRRVPPTKTSEGVEVRRGGEFIGNRMRFKVKVLNDSPYIITDVTVYLLSYPKDALRFAGEDHDTFFGKIEPGGFRSPTFDFLPTQDCVKGEIVAGVSYMDMRGQPHTLTAKPFVIRSVCDLLIPQQVTPQDFQLKLKDLECGEIVIKIEEWTPEEMFEKSLRIVDESNFFEVSTKSEETEGVFFGTIVGFAKGKYTGKDVGVEITITGPTGVKGASCTIQVSGEDQAMILPAIDDLRERLSAWLCPMCSSPLTLANVEELRKGNVVVCPFCGVSIGR